MRAFDPVWRVVRGVLLGIAALIVFIEEFGWEPLSAWLGRLAQWPPLHRLEERIRHVPAKAGLVLFLIPAVLLFPIKLAALGLIHAGHAASGLAVIVIAKVAGTAFAGRLFVLLEPQLMQFAWFARALEWWRATKRQVHAALERSASWRAFQDAGRSVWAWLQRVSR